MNRINPKQALEDYLWLRDQGYLKDITSQYPMTEKFFITEMGIRMKFQEGSKLYNLAATLRSTREDLE